MRIDPRLTSIIDAFARASQTQSVVKLDDAATPVIQPMCCTKPASKINLSVYIDVTSPIHTDIEANITP